MTHKQSIPAFTLIELMVTTVLGAILWTSAFSVITNIQLQQKKIVIAQSFYNESTILKDRIVQMVRNNTIDYDRHWQEEMRDSPSNDWSNDCKSEFSDKEFNGILIKSDLSNMTYPMTFYRNTRTDKSEILDRNLAGAKVSGSSLEADPCTFAMPETREYGNFIYLINAGRNVRQAIKFESDGATSKGTIEIQTFLGADTDNDGLADLWGKGTWNGSACLVGTSSPAINIDSEDSCDRSHDYKSITPPDVNIKDMKFTISPIQDPYLAWRSDEAQVHPHAHIFFSAEYQGKGFDASEFPTLDLLTSASSRVYGDTRR